MGGAGVRNAGLWDERGQHVSGTAQFNNPGGRGVFPIGKKKKKLGCTFQSAFIHTQIYGNEQCGLQGGCCAAGLASV